MSEGESGQIVDAREGGEIWADSHASESRGAADGEVIRAVAQGHGGVSEAD